VYALRASEEGGADCASILGARTSAIAAAITRNFLGLMGIISTRE
jgi:hypothetical protein